LTGTETAIEYAVLVKVLSQWPDRSLDPGERFAEWMAILGESNAWQFELLHLAFRVTPLLGADLGRSHSSALVVADDSGRRHRPDDAGKPADATDEDELSILLSSRLEVPLALTLGVDALALYVPSTGRRKPRQGGTDRRILRSLCLLTLIDPGDEDTAALPEADVVGLLARLKSWAKQLHRNRDHAVPAVLAGLVYTVANVLALVRYRVVLHTLHPTQLANNIRWFLGRAWLDARPRPVLEEGLAALDRPAAAGP
jgi:hypothetical protein